MIIIDPPPTSIGIARVVLAALGVAIALGGVAWGLAWIPADQYAAVAIWLIAALVIGDGVIAPLVVAFGMLGARTAQRIGAGAAALARAALVTAAVCSLVAIPGIVVSAQGPRNDTIHTVDYLLVLAIAWATAVAVSIGAVIVGGMRHRHGGARPRQRRPGVRARTKWRAPDTE